MVRHAGIACVGLAVLASGCARDNPLFGLGLRPTEGGSIDSEEDGGDGIVTSGDDVSPTGEGGGTLGSGNGTTGSDAASTGDDPDGMSTGQPADTTIGDTDTPDTSSTAGPDTKDLVLFRGPDVLGNFGAGAPPDNTYGAAVQLCMTYVAKNGMPCDGSATVFAVLRAEPTLVIDVDMFPGEITDRAVVGPLGDLVAESAAQLFDGMLFSPLADAAVVDEPFWTGGYDNGVGTDADCSDWHSENAFGWAGDPTVTNALWFEAQDLDCVEMHPIVCACAE